MSFNPGKYISYFIYRTFHLCDSLRVTGKVPKFFKIPQDVARRNAEIEKIKKTVVLLKV